MSRIITVEDLLSVTHIVILESSTPDSYSLARVVKAEMSNQWRRLSEPAENYRMMLKAMSHPDIMSALRKTYPAILSPEIRRQGNLPSDEQLMSALPPAIPGEPGGWRTKGLRPQQVIMDDVDSEPPLSAAESPTTPELDEFYKWWNAIRDDNEDVGKFPAVAARAAWLASRREADAEGKEANQSSNRDGGGKEGQNQESEDSTGGDGVQDAPVARDFTFDPSKAVLEYDSSIPPGQVHCRTRPRVQYLNPASVL